MTKLRTQALPFIAATEKCKVIVAAVAPEGRTQIVNGWKKPENVHVLLITGDRGLCGRFNSNTIRAMLQNSAKAQGRSVSFSSIGYKGHHFLKRKGFDIRHYWEKAAAHPSWESAKTIGSELFQSFESETFHEVWMVYSKRTGSFTEEPVVSRLLPFALIPEEQKIDTDYILEDSAERILIKAAELFVQSRVYEAILDSAVAEHAARMSAMDNASSNCDRLLGQYIQLRNRARQAVITTELNEIVTGKEALES